MLRGIDSENLTASAAYEGARAVNVSQLVTNEDCGVVSVWVAGDGECERCRSMDGKPIGKGGVFPPLHKGCDCSVGFKKYEEVLTDEPTEWYKEHVGSDEEAKARYLKTLATAKAKSNIEGNLLPPRLPKDLENFRFDKNHIKNEKNRDITREEAEGFVRNAVVMIERNKSQYLNYYSIAGGCYTIVSKKLLRTAFKKDVYQKDVNAMMEVIESEYGRDGNVSDIRP